MCNEYKCEVESLGINRCSDGLILFLNEPIGTRLIACLKANGKQWLVATRVECGGLISIDWRPAEYLMGSHKVKLNIERLNGNPVSIPYGDDCEEVCGIEFHVGENCEKGYKYINIDCATDFSHNWSIPINNCNWNINVYKCNWTINNMVDKIKYGSVEYPIQSNPILVTNGVASVNPGFEAELNSIENGAWTLSIVDDEVIVNYVGTELIEIYDNCKKLEKDCE
jgi:hypothetical protein